MADLSRENFLSLADGELSADLRERLALATRYIANWYRATSSSEDKELWWAKIDNVRSKVEGVYGRLLAPANATFPGRIEVAQYNEASAAWASLWRELTLSADTIDVPLIYQAASFVDTVVSAPGLLVVRVVQEIGKTAGSAAAAAVKETWPLLVGAAVLGGVYLFRRPLLSLIAKVA